MKPTSSCLIGRWHTFLIIAAAVFLFPGLAPAQCSDEETMGVFIVSGIYPGTELQIERLHLHSVGEATYPDQQQLIDSRDGVVTFAGTVIWMGVGTTSWPIQSSHEWNFIDGPPAEPPGSLEIMDNLMWPDSPQWEIQYGSEADIADSVLNHLRQLDVLHSFAQCGDYSAISYVYTPAVGMVIPSLAQCVMVVRGFCGPPWNGAPVSAENLSWGGVKGLYR